jgi:L-cysteine:1D-myo-inositol 2-amino-2-deoxy-alpha-D-glucopyranoside ligase
VLWQPSAPGEPAWGSLWGPGRPGWHIECSALVIRELGLTIDLHGGGSDLIFPHHECEAAQSAAATGEPLTRHWAHAGMVGYQGTKMSKSLGNLVFVRDLLKTWEPAAIRLAILAHRYRLDWEWEEHLLIEATARLARWRGQGNGEGDSGRDVVDDVRAALDDDLDTPAALAAIDAAAAAGAAGHESLVAAASLLGVVL